MHNALLRNTRLLALSGVATIAFGVIALLWPGLTFVAFLALFGSFAFVTGALTLSSGLNMLAERQSYWVPYVIGGLSGIAVGAATFMWPGWTALTLVYLIAFWAITTGVFETVAAIELAGRLDGDWMLGLSGALSVAFGTLVAIYPRSGALAIIWIIGLYAVLGGVTRLYVAYRVGRADKVISSILHQPAGHS